MTPASASPIGSRLQQVVHVLRLIHVEHLCVAVSNSWLVVGLAWHVEERHRRNPLLDELPMSVVLLCSAVASAGLYVYGRALNDVMDSRHDRAFWPQRPIPAGQLQRGWAITLGVASLLAAVLAAIFLGREPSLVCLATAAAILFFNAAARFFPAVGLVLIGLIHAAGMLLPNPRLGFIWPVWLGMTHVTICSAIVYWLAGKRPRLHAGHLWALGAGWLYWTLALIGGTDQRGSLLIHDRPWVAIAPTFLVAAFGVLTAVRLAPTAHSPRFRRASAESFNRLGLRHQILYNVAWLGGVGLWPWALGHLVLWMGSWAIPACLGVLQDLVAESSQTPYQITGGPEPPPSEPRPGYALDGPLKKKNWTHRTGPTAADGSAQR